MRKIAGIPEYWQTAVVYFIRLHVSLIFAVWEVGKETWWEKTNSLVNKIKCYFEQKLFPVEQSQ